MNILELDSYRLSDAVKFNDQLNPRLWDDRERMRPEVREQLLKIADDFAQSLGITDLQLKDITVSGSNAAYTYTPHSDIDLHLVIDLPEADVSEVYRELFDAKKYQYNDQHNITIGGYDVELYVQNANQSHISQGIYSVLNDQWIQVPSRKKPTVDDISAQSKYETLKQHIEQAIHSQDYERISAMADKIKKMRQAGLEQHGEFGPENLAFKMLRTQGQIEKLYTARNAAKDQSLSLDERKKKKSKKRFAYGTFGGYWYPGTAYAGQDHPAGAEGGDGGGESIRETQESVTDEQILQNFVKFVIKELNIEHMPRVKLRRDPEWPKRNKTFGRYIDDTKTLEVAWGNRHVMDVLRTVAHELTHKRQHEREDVPMDAGETGSKYENEANARAGILMRDWARLHPEHFDHGQMQDLEEASPAQQLSLYKPDGTTYRGEKMPGYDPDDFHSETNPKKRIDRLTHQDLSNRTATDLVDPIERAEKNIDKERLKSAIRASMSSLTSNETAVLNMRFWKDLTLAQTAKALNSSTERIRQIEAKALRKLRHESRSDRLEPFVKEGASGYIPTRKQAKDPRYSMALTVDIRPGQVGKEANKLGLKTNKQGQPQVARANGLFEKLALELSQFKNNDLNEVLNTVPGKSNRAKWSSDDDGHELNFVASNGIKYRINFVRPESGPDVFNQYKQLPDATDEILDAGKFIDFEQTSDSPYKVGKQGIENTGSAAEVFGIVYNAILQYIQKFQPTYFYFQAAEPSRRSLYTALINKMLPSLPGWKLKQSGGEFVVYNNKLFKKHKIAEDLETLDEVKMSPSALQQWAQSDAAQGIRAGFEAELIFRDTVNDNDDEYDMEPDYDYDERVRSVDNAIDFFQGGDYGDMSSRDADRLRNDLDEKYYEWYDERMYDAFRDEAEDLVRRVIEEEDWDLDSEIQKQLELAEVPEDEFNAVIQAGERAPRFTSTKEQQAYAEANPLYTKYLDAQTEAEDLLDELVEDSVRAQDKYYDAALDDFRENFQIDDDSDFFESIGLTYMSDIAAEYSLSWPYLTGSGGGNNGGSRDWESIGDSLHDTVGMRVDVSSNYHSTKRRPDVWILEPDSSLSPDDREDMGLEIVSPPMPLLTTMEKLQAVTDWANNPSEGNAYTNSSTGLHMGVSVPYKGGDVDYLKLILFLGDEYVLQSFGREANTYTKSAMSKFRENIKGGRADPAGAMALMKSNLIEFAYREIQKGVGEGKYTSAHIQDGYIEFRSAGGDWLAEGDAEPGKLENTMLRYARAMQIAADPSAERREFAKKLYKLVAPEGDGQLALFSQYAAGEIDKEQLKKQWAEKTIGTERKTNQRWKLYDRSTGEPVAGQEYNGYTEEEARARAKGKLRPSASDRDFDSAYELRNMSEEQQWEVYDVNTGETLEIVKGKNKGEAADAVFDKYAAQNIGFNVRPYQDPATMTPRAKLAKRIAQPKAGQPVLQNYEVVDQRDVNLRVVGRFQAQSNNAAEKYSLWLKTNNLPDDTEDYGYRKAAATSAEAQPNVGQNFDSARDSASLQTSLQGRASQDATDVPRNWEFVNRINGQVIHNMTNASYNQANIVQDNLETRYPDADIFLRSVERST